MMLNFKQQIIDHPYMVSFFALLSTLLKFVVQSWQVDGVLFIFLFFMISIDTYIGVRLAKKTGTYDYKLLKEKGVKKVLGYVIFLMALWTFTMMLFLMNIKDGAPFVDSYYLNIPMMTSMLFFAGIEFLSIKDNLSRIFGIRMPTAVIDKVETFISSGGDADQIPNPSNQARQ
ncbi:MULTISPECIES: phage holin family protein [Emticicia]|uniref:phage holin family protein n=1 Tax=Emticicia TaxID=312278 RepID=UPI0013046664|nr:MULTISPECIES: phage holin family protein [Emticicia]UTA66537.1 phage holin family protein [Emticicia sp. 21SJ11W-3]